jgi:hypothetical protein
MKILGHTFGKGNKPVDIPVDTTNNSGKENKGSRHSDNVNKPQPDRIKMELGTLRNNIELAADTDNPSYYDMYRMFFNSLTDAEVKTQLKIAKNKVKAEEFIIQKDGVDNEELTKLIERPWFDQFLGILVEAEQWGYTIIEFGQFDDNGEFISCKTFPRFNVYPFKKELIIEYTDTEGIPYSNDDADKGDLINPEDFFLIEINDTDDVGNIEELTREVIIKSFSRRDWNEHSEKWGQPRIAVKTDAEGNDLTALENGVSNFARNGYAIVNKDDEIEKFEASSNGSGYLIYDKNIDKSDKYIAKLINGQAVVGNENSYVGSSEVSERVLNDYHHSRLREYQKIINYRLIPFLTYWGYPLEGCTGYYPALLKKPIPPTETNTDIDPDEQDPGTIQKPNARAAAVKKKAPVTPW